MAQPDPVCPVCDADLVLAGDEHPGDQVFCTYCGAPCTLGRPPSDDQAWEVEEDF